jgi:hypothetical protein
VDWWECWDGIVFCLPFLQLGCNCGGDVPALTSDEENWNSKSPFSTKAKSVSYKSRGLAKRKGPSAIYRVFSFKTIPENHL